MQTRAMMFLTAYKYTHCNALFMRDQREME